MKHHVFRSLTVPLLALGLIGITGCATVVLPQGPDLTSLAPLTDVPTIAVPKPADAREKPRRAGSIGLAALSLKADPSNLIAREAVAALHGRRLNGDLIPVAADDLPRQLEEVARRQAHGTLVITMKDISIQSFDALLDAPAATVTLEASLYAPDGNLLGRGTASGRAQHRINTFALNRTSGALIVEAAHQALEHLVSRSTIAGALNQLRIE